MTKKNTSHGCELCYVSVINCHLLPMIVLDGHANVDRYDSANEILVYLTM